MTNVQIRYMIEVAETGSINQAAKNLFISQSSLSNSIQSVEAEFGRKIFNRTAKGVSLTSFGKLFISYISPINKQLEQLYNMRSVDVTMPQAALSVISNGFFYISQAAAVFARRQANSSLRLSICEDYSGDITDAIGSGEADLGIVRIWSCYWDNMLARYRKLGLQYHPLCEMQVGITVGPKNPLYHAEISEVEAEELSRYTQILHRSLDCGPYADIYRRIGILPSQNRLIVDSRAVIYEMLKYTDGYVLDSRKPGLQGNPMVEERFLPIRNCPIHSEIGWLIQENSALTAESREFIHVLQDYLVDGIELDYNS